MDNSVAAHNNIMYQQQYVVFPFEHVVVDDDLFYVATIDELA